MPSESHNPFGLCTWDDAADCDGCGLRDKLHCRWDATVLGRFLIPASAFSLIAVLGVGLASYVTGEWGILALYLTFFVVFFLAVEIRVLCSHCPYYAREGSFLRCLANCGAPRLWRYRPGPMSISERITLIIGFAVFAGYPLVAQVYGICRLTGLGDVAGAKATLPTAFIVAAATLVALVIFAAVLTAYFCPRCVNFSCPLNRVPPAVREEYRAKNPILLGE